MAISVPSPLPTVQTMRAAADVLEVDEDDDLCASVLVMPGAIAVARLNRSIRDTPHEGRVLRWTMLHTTGAFGNGFFIYRLSDALERLSVRQED